MLGLSWRCEGYGQEEDEVIVQPEAFALPVTFERFFINTDLMPPLQRFAKSSNKAIYLISLKILRSW